VTITVVRNDDPANVEREAVWLDRVTAADLMLIWPEEQGWPQYIGALVILDGGALFAADGAFLIGVVREAIDRRLHLVPRFRQVLCAPRQLRADEPREPRAAPSRRVALRSWRSGPVMARAMRYAFPCAGSMGPARYAGSSYA
jgi:hypothetical protein